MSWQHICSYLMFFYSGNCCKVSSVLRYCNKGKIKKNIGAGKLLSNLYSNKFRRKKRTGTHRQYNTVRDWPAALHQCRSGHFLRKLILASNATLSLFTLCICLTPSPSVCLSLSAHSLFLLTVTLIWHQPLWLADPARALTSDTL